MAESFPDVRAAALALLNSGAKLCQLEALAPDQIAVLLRTAIEDVLDLELIASDLSIEANEREQLVKFLLPAPSSTAGCKTEGAAA